MDILFHPNDFNAIIKGSICVLYNNELSKKTVKQRIYQKIVIFGT
jgi:hypothetical protein